MLQQAEQSLHWLVNHDAKRRGGDSQGRKENTDPLTDNM
jgi:hypothetical protein